MLRFKRDDGTSYAEWGSNRITEVAETYIGLVTTMTAHYVPDGIPLIRNSDIKENKFVFKDPIYLDNEFAEKNKTRAHELGDIVTVHTGDVGTSAVINQELEGSIGFATIVTRIINKEKNIPQFVCWYYNSPKNKKNVINLITGDGRNNLNMRDFNKLVIPIPCSEEQQKIADFLSEVDNIIAASEQEIESLELQKKGAMQKIFSQEVRFKADDGSKYPEWEEKTFSQVMESFEYGMNAAAIEYDGENKYLRITDIDEISHRYSSNDIVSPSGDLDDKYLVKYGDVFFARTGASVGKSYLYRLEDGKMYFAGFLIKGHVKEAFNPYYIFCQTLTEQYKKWVKVMSVRSGQPGINSQEYASYKFLCSINKEEQQKIADFLSEFDNAIEYAKEELEIWKNIKKGLLQQMFE